MKNMKRLVGCNSAVDTQNRPNNIGPVKALLVLDTLHTERDSHTASDAKRREALRSVATL